MFLLQYLCESCFCVQLVFVNIGEPQSTDEQQQVAVVFKNQRHHNVRNGHKRPIDIGKHLRTTEQVVNEIELTLLRKL